MTSAPSTLEGKSNSMRRSPKTIIVGVSGPSSSGKTTLARLLRTIFNPSPLISEHSAPESDFQKPFCAFILHEDDFYKSDDQIPVTTTASGKLVEDWDTIDALNISQLSSTLSYVSEYGELPANLKSKEDLNEATDSGVDDAIIAQYRNNVAERLRELLSERNGEQRSAETDNAGKHRVNSHGRHGDEGHLLSVAFVDGFLLYAPPQDAGHPLTPIQTQIDIPLFLPATYSLLKERREGRTGYVTVGPAPTPTLKSKDGNDGTFDGQESEAGTEAAREDDTNDGGYDPPEQSFWTDPPGYVDDIVWPRYIEDFAWLLLPESVHPKNHEELKHAVGEGENLRQDVGVIVGPGKGEASISELLSWAVEEVMKGIERAVA